MRINEILNELGVGGGRSFKGSPCTKDCSGHSAGYTWAKKKGVKNRNQCPVKPSHQSFSNGCRIAGDEESEDTE